MQRLSKGMEVGRVLTWLKSVGDTVSEGDPVVEVETDKAIVELQAPGEGVLLRINVNEDQQVPVGTVLGWIGQAGENVEASQSPPAAVDSASTKARAAPAVRRLAAEHGIDLNQITGSGLGGRITRADVVAAVEGRQAESELSRQDPEAQRVKLCGLRQAMARRLAGSQAVAATTIADVDMSAVRNMRQQHAVTYTAVVVRAAALALREHRGLNASLDGDDILQYQQINIGVAVDGPRGLAVVTMPRADEQPLIDLNQQLRGRIDQVQHGGLASDDVARPTFTVTNSGVLGSLMFTPVINPPQSAVLGMGKV